MGKFKVGDLVVIARPSLERQKCYRGFVRRVSSIEGDDLYGIGDMGEADVYWFGDELDLAEDNVESLYPKVPPMLYNFTLSDMIENTYNKVCKRIVFDKECSDDDLKYCMNDITTTNTYVENKEEKEMNKVLNLWYDRKRKAINKRYDNLREEFNEQYGSIQSFNELVDKFNKDLEELYNYDKATEQFVLTENAPSNVIKYKVDTNRIDDYFNKMYCEKIKQDYQEIDDIKEEVEAQLSLSNDLEYQRKILKKYGIINKVTEKISE